MISIKTLSQKKPGETKYKQEKPDLAYPVTSECILHNYAGYAGADWVRRLKCAGQRRHIVNIVRTHQIPKSGKNLLTNTVSAYHPDPMNAGSSG